MIENLRASVVQSNRLALSLFAGIGMFCAVFAYFVDDSVVRFLMGFCVGAAWTAFLDQWRSTKRLLQSMDRRP